jgi:hypothetical protein
MFFCFAVRLSASSDSPVPNPCHPDFLSGFRANCSNVEDHFCGMGEWMCVVHEHNHHGARLFGACLGGSHACFLSVDPTSEKCLGHCADQNQVFRLATAATVFGTVLLISVIVGKCLCLCCCCGCCACLIHHRKLIKKPRCLQSEEERRQSQALADGMMAPLPGGPMYPPVPYPGYAMPWPQQGAPVQGGYPDQPAPPVGPDQGHSPL